MTECLCGVGDAGRVSATSDNDALLRHALCSDRNLVRFRPDGRDQSIVDSVSSARRSGTSVSCTHPDGGMAMTA